MADIGYIALILALIVSIYCIIAYAVSARTGSPAFGASAWNGVVAAFVLVSLAGSALFYAIFSNDFELRYVAEHSSRELAGWYKLAVLYAGNAGSLLLWSWFLALFGLLAAIQLRRKYPRLLPYSLAIVMGTEAFFLLLTVALANPFEKLSSIPANGTGLNPLLQNPGMLFHPPTLLAGYVGYTVPFAIALSSLLAGHLKEDWWRASRNWALAAWLFLGVGNLLGAQWAYVELGWGGYWAWDAVENAGLMPWLVGTALLHSFLMQRQRGSFKLWSLALVVLAFLLSVFGTFLTRSGILSSIHTFGASAMGPFFLTFLGLSLAGSCGLLIYRYGALGQQTETESVISKESTFTLNNIILMVITAVVFVGTTFPALSEAVGGSKVAVGPEFFNKVSGPLFLALVFLIGACTLISWRRTPARRFLLRLAPALAVALVAGIVLGVSVYDEWYTAAIFAVAVFVASGLFLEWFRDAWARRQAKSESYLRALVSVLASAKRRYGARLVHLSIVIMVIGIAGSSLYQLEKEVTLPPGGTVSIGKYTLNYESIASRASADRLIAQAQISVYNEGKPLGNMNPELYFTMNYDPVPEVAIKATMREDLYVVMAGLDQQDNATFKILVNPLVNWLWIGGLVFILGGLIAFWPERRQPAEEASA